MASVVLLMACSGATEGTVSDAGAGSSVPGLDVLYEAEDGPYALTLDDRYIYWVSGAGLRRAPLEGGAPVTLATASAVRGLTPAGEYLYFYQGSIEVPDSIGRVPREGGDTEWVADAENPQSLVANADSVFWAESGDDWNTGRLWRAGLDGSGPTELAAGLVSPRSLALDGEQLYFENGNVTNCVSGGPIACLAKGFSRVSISAGLPERVVSAATGSTPVWNDGAMYWLAGDPRPSHVVMLPPGGAVQPVTEMLMDSPGDGDRLLSDADALYWDTGSRVLRMPFATREVERLVNGLEENSLALRGDGVYVAEGAKGRILRIATDGSAYRPTAVPITGPCPTPLGSAEELTLTPRAEPNLELLAFELEPENVVASQATYDRLVSDVSAVRALQPTLAEVTYSSPYGNQEIQLQLTNEASQASADGQYTAWDCLNDAYGPRYFNQYGATVELWLRGTYNLPLVLARYLRLPGVTGGSSGVTGDGPTICVSREGERYEYVFDDTGGGCPGICTEHRAYYFASDASSQLTQIAVWDSKSGASAPTWFRDICDSP